MKIKWFESFAEIGFLLKVEFRQKMMNNGTLIDFLSQYKDIGFKKSILGNVFREIIRQFVLLGPFKAFMMIDNCRLNWRHQSAFIDKMSSFFCSPDKFLPC